MTTSPQWAPAAQPDGGSDVEFDLLVDESTSSGASAWAPSHDLEASCRAGVWSADFSGTADGSGEPTAAHVVSSTEYAAAEGTPGRGVILSAALATAAAAVLDLALVGRLSFFFDVSFVVICLAAAMAVRPRDLFTAAVLPPLAYAGAIGGVALIWPDAIVADRSLSTTFLTGLAAHAVGLVGGYAAALLTVAARAYARRQS